MSAARVFLKYWLPLVLWTAMIFYGSTDALSTQRTSRLIGPLLRWVNPDVSEAAIHRVQFVIRKTGHVAVYAVLAVLFWWARRRPLRNDPRPWSWKEAGWAVFFGTLYAVTDEFHQSLVASRQGSGGDVLLDGFGAALGILVLWRVGRWRQWWR